MTDDPEIAHGPLMDDSYGATLPPIDPLEDLADHVFAGLLLEALSGTRGIAEPHQLPRKRGLLGALLGPRERIEVVMRDGRKFEVSLKQTKKRTPQAGRG